MKARKNLMLPSGATCAVRKLAAYDFVSLGEIPTPAIAAEILERKKNNPGTVTKEDVEFGVKVAKLALTRACSPIRFSDGEQYKVVDKEFHQCASGEISVEELDQADADCIVREVTALSQMGKEAAQAAKPFSEKSQVAGDDPSSRENLRSPAESGSAV